MPKNVNKYLKKMKKMYLNDIKNVLVIGAGTMGHSIAQVYATHGFNIDLVDIK